MGRPDQGRACLTVRSVNSLHVLPGKARYALSAYSELSQAYLYASYHMYLQTLRSAPGQVSVFYVFVFPSPQAISSGGEAAVAEQSAAVLEY